MEAKTADGRMLGQEGLVDILSTLDASRPDTPRPRLYEKSSPRPRPSPLSTTTSPSSSPAPTA